MHFRVLATFACLSAAIFAGVNIAAERPARQAKAQSAILALALATSLFAQSGSKGSVTLIHRAKGAFDIKMTSMPADDYDDGKTLGRVAADKQYHGDLEGSGKGQMLTATGEVTGSAVYVATERVIGNLGGRRGTFLLAYRGVMNRGAQQLEVDVVPDSGAGELQGIAGKLAIKVTPDGRCPAQC